MFLYVLAVVLAVAGIVQLFQGQIFLGLVMIILACLLGPGGYSIIRRRN